MSKKYEFTGETTKVDGHTLHRIRAVRCFSDVKAGDFGGWKDGTMTVRTHPLLDIRNKLQKQWQADWQAHRQEAFRRIQMKRMQQKQTGTVNDVKRK